MMSKEKTDEYKAYIRKMLLIKQFEHMMMEGDRADLVPVFVRNQKTTGGRDIYFVQCDENKMPRTRVIEFMNMSIPKYEPVNENDSIVYKRATKEVILITRPIMRHDRQIERSGHDGNVIAGHIGQYIDRDLIKVEDLSVSALLAMVDKKLEDRDATEGFTS